MKKVYYLCHCGSGTSVHMKLIDLVREEGNKLIFHINDYDWDYNKSRTITLKAFREKRRDYKGEITETIRFRSSKEQYRFSFIREIELEDNVEPKRYIVEC